jgi:hypothetical protein
MMCLVFIPKMTRVVLEIPLPAGPGATERHEFPMRVQRVVMTDRRPAYLVGLVFDGPADDTAGRERLEALIAGLDADEAGDA